MIDLDEALLALDSPDAAARADAVRILGARGEAPRVGSEIMRLLTDDDELVRCEAADALGLLAHIPSLHAICLRLRTDRSALVRAAAAETLGDLGQPAAITDLVGTLDDEDAAVRGYTANSLGLLVGPELLPVLDLRLGVESAPAVRAELHGARYRLGAPGALDDLLAMLDVMDGDLGVNVLNVWDDLIRRRPPPTLMTDAPVIAAALNRVADRLPGLRSHAEELATRIGR